MQHLPRGAVKIVRNFDTWIFKILIIKLVLFSEELYYVSVLWFIYSSCLPGLHFGCFCCLNVISLVPYFLCYCLLYNVVSESFSKFVLLSLIRYSIVPLYDIPSPIFLITETAWRSCYCYYTSVAESLRHIKIIILLSIWRTVISKFLTKFLM